MYPGLIDLHSQEICRVVTCNLQAGVGAVISLRAARIEDADMSWPEARGA